MHRSPLYASPGDGGSSSSDFGSCKPSAGTTPGMEGSCGPRHRIDSCNGPGMRIADVIADHSSAMVVMMAVVVMTVTVMVPGNENIKVVENEKPREEEPAAPERRWHPGVQVAVIRWRRIVGHHRGAFFGVIIVDHRRIGVGIVRRRWAFGILPGRIRDNSHVK